MSEPSIRVLMSERVLLPYDETRDYQEVIWAHLIVNTSPGDDPSSSFFEPYVGGVLAAGSTIIWPGGSAILYEDGGTFVESGSSSSDSGGGSVEPA